MAVMIQKQKTPDRRDVKRCQLLRLMQPLKTQSAGRTGYVTHADAKGAMLAVKGHAANR